MKRRNFIASLFAPFVVKKAEAEETFPGPPVDWKPYVVAVDWHRDSVEMCKREDITKHSKWKLDRQNEELDRLHNLVQFNHRVMTSDSFKATTFIFDNARRVAAELEGKNIPAADLTDAQKCAILLLAGFMKYEDGKMVSIRPVGIADRGDGGYIVGIAPESHADR